MSNYTSEDVTSYFSQPLTPNQINGVLAYLNEGKVPPADPCLSCEPNTIRKLIGKVQRVERERGVFPRVQRTSVLVVADEAESPAAGRLELHDEFVPEKVIAVSDNPTDPDVNFDEVFKPKPKPRKGK